MTSNYNAKAILALLGIPEHLSDREDHGLQVAYQKYKGFLEASQTYKSMVAKGTWIGPKLNGTQLIELFVSKSFYHSHYTKILSRISSNPQNELLIQWLEASPEDRPNDLEVWGYEKPSYKYSDLEELLDKNERNTLKKGKGVKKDKGKGKEKEVEKKKSTHKKKL